MAVNVIDIIKPKNNGVWPVTEDTEHKGGWRVSATLLDRDAIPAGRRKEGMRVRVPGLLKSYELVGGITNGDWVEINEGVVAPSQQLEQTLSDITMYVDPVSGTSPPAGTTIHSQAEYNALGYDLLYPQDVLDVVPAAVNHVVVARCKAGDHLAKLSAIGPFPFGTFFLPRSHINTSRDTVASMTAPYYFTPGIYFVNDSYTTIQADVSGSHNGYKTITVAGASFTPNEFENKFLYVKSGVNAGSFRLIKYNTATQIVVTNALYTSGAMTFDIYDLNVNFLCSNDGVNPMWGYGFTDWGNSQTIPIMFYGIQFGTSSIKWEGAYTSNPGYYFYYCRFLTEDYYMHFVISQANYVQATGIMGLWGCVLDQGVDGSSGIQMYDPIPLIFQLYGCRLIMRSANTYGINLIGRYANVYSGDNDYIGVGSFNTNMFYIHSDSAIYFSGQDNISGTASSNGIVSADYPPGCTIRGRIYIGPTSIAGIFDTGGRFVLIPFGNNGSNNMLGYRVAGGTELVFRGDPSGLPIDPSGNALQIDGEYFTFAELNAALEIIGQYGSRVRRSA